MSNSSPYLGRGVKAEVEEDMADERDVDSSKGREIWVCTIALVQRNVPSFGMYRKPIKHMFLVYGRIEYI